jgi:hypothetical protein
MRMGFTWKRWTGWQAPTGTEQSLLAGIDSILSKFGKSLFVGLLLLSGYKGNWMGSVLLLRTQSFWRRLRFLYPLTAILSFSCPKSWRQPTSSPGFSRRLIRPAIIAGVSLSLLNRGRT